MKAAEVDTTVRGVEGAVVVSKSQDLVAASVAVITEGVVEEVITCAVVIATSTITVVVVIWVEETDTNSITIKARIIR